MRLWYIISEQRFRDTSNQNINESLEKVVFIVNFEHISYLVLLFLLLTLNKYMLAGLRLSKNKVNVTHLKYFRDP